MERKLSLYEIIKQEIFRIAWRIQYRAKVLKKREVFFNTIEPANHCLLRM
ncbi:hypothetical protein ACFSTH_05925 [Paenibacillus yanchengensis]|uniref:Uncharacterized protein n=1 Tax=Paenibacillus yanchengensis TaxID=2035833 RepID=A0ABW4YHG5_9BACL